MKGIKKFLREIDLFGITFTFRYKNDEKYQTPFGGLFNILFMILALSLGIYYFIPFIKRKNYAIVYYTMNLSTTEEVNFSKSKSNFAIGLTCQGNPKEKIPFTDLLRLQIRYTKYIKSNNGSFEYNRKILQTHSCTYEDFYNKYNAQFDYLALQNYECINDNDYSIEGVYADQIFSYFDFSVMAMNNSTQILDELDRFLFENDCKFNLVYTDIIINLDNYKEPITQFLSNIFIQLNPTLLVKRNMYFMNQYFFNDNYLIWIFTDDSEKAEIKALYSRYEEYYLYKGINRSKTYVDDFISYARIFMRSDLRKTEIKRKYQKLMEFYADASSLLAAIYAILNIIFGFINNFYAYHSLAKRLFFFKELEDYNFHIFDKNKQIKELLSKMSENNNAIEENNANVLNNEYKEPTINDDNKATIYSPKNKTTNKRQSNNRIFKSNLDPKNVTDKSSNIKFIKVKKVSVKKKRDNYSKSNKVLVNIIEPQKIEVDSEKSNEETIKYKFNIFDIIISQFFPCCMTKKLSLKSSLNEKADEIIYQKMDIILYIRNMILFDIMNKTILDSNTKAIINFLCRPIITNDKNSDNEFGEFYKNYNENDFEKLYEYLPELIQKTSKENRENRLVSLSYQHLKELV